jgi:hydrogenase nickel incorporation protein HypA/HybF
MHELSIAQSILEIVETEMKSRPNARAMVVGVRIGAMAAIDPESLRFGFDASVKGTDLDGLKLELRITEAERQCLMCDHRYKMLALESNCPECGSHDAIPLGGDELDIEYLEVDDGKTGD